MPAAPRRQHARIPPDPTPHDARDDRSASVRATLHSRVATLAIAAARTEHTCPTAGTAGFPLETLALAGLFSRVCRVKSQHGNGVRTSSGSTVLSINPAFDEMDARPTRSRPLAVPRHGGRTPGPAARRSSASSPERTAVTSPLGRAPFRSDALKYYRALRSNRENRPTEFGSGRDPDPMPLCTQGPSGVNANDATSMGRSTRSIARITVVVRRAYDPFATYDMIRRK